MKTQLYDINAENIGEVTLPEKAFSAKVSDILIAQAIKVYLNNQRKSHAKVKNRSEVAGTTKKVWAQKGTGRARHGSAKAPIFVGGGSAHGPDGDRNYKLSLSKQMRRQALASILGKFAKSKSIIVIEKINTITPKTKIGWDLMEKLEAQNDLLAKSRKIGIITSKTVSNTRRAFRNITNINLLSLKSLNVYDLSNQNFLIFSKKAIEKLSK